MMYLLQYSRKVGEDDSTFAMEEFLYPDSASAVRDAKRILAASKEGEWRRCIVRGHQSMYHYIVFEDRTD